MVGLCVAAIRLYHVFLCSIQYGKLYIFGGFRLISVPKTKFWFASSVCGSWALRAPVLFTVSVYERVTGDLTMLHENRSFDHL